MTIFHDVTRSSFRTIEFAQDNTCYYAIIDTATNEFKEISIVRPGEFDYHRYTWDQLTLEEQKTLEAFL